MIKKKEDGETDKLLDYLEDIDKWKLIGVNSDKKKPGKTPEARGLTYLEKKKLKRQEKKEERERARQRAREQKIKEYQEKVERKRLL